jgi:hypothetical protein
LGQGYAIYVNGAIPRFKDNTSFEDNKLDTTSEIYGAAGGWDQIP